LQIRQFHHQSRSCFSSMASRPTSSRKSGLAKSRLLKLLIIL
jgi:hypothetical protein